MTDFIFVDKNALDNDNIKLLQQFEENIYNKSFPDDEREYFNDILRRVKCENEWEPQTFIILYKQNDVLVGGVIADWYEKCQSLEIIYIVIEPSCRGVGNGEYLLWTSINLIKDSINDIKNIFIEVEKVHNRKLMEGEMDPSKRISFWEKCGAKPININYIQPPLSQDKEAISNLTLMVLPLERGKQIILEKNILIKFLSDFYIGLCCGDSIFLKKMIEEINITNI